MKSLNHDLSVSLSQYATRQYQTPLLLIDQRAFGDLICKERDFIIVPIHSDIEINKYLVIAPFALNDNQTVTTDYGSVFLVVNVLCNYEHEIEGLEPGYMILTVEQLFTLDESIVNGAQQLTLH